MLSPVLVCFVIGIADGDTLTARCQTGTGPANLVVRLAEIDAPERRQPFGDRSRQHLAALCFNKQAEIHRQAVDRYRRTVARVACDRVDANAQQVHSGMAWAYTPYVRDPRLTQYERVARERRLGLWADRSPIPPWNWRRSAAR